MTRLRCGAFLVLIVALVFSLCSSGTASGSAAPVTVKGPGTPLRNGFVVADDTGLVGTVFPLSSNQWQAVVTIDRDPLGAYDAYVAQARALRFKLGGSGSAIVESRGGLPALGTCQSYSREGDPRPGSDASFLACAGSAQRQDATGTAGVELSMQWGGSNHHLVLTFTMNAVPCPPPCGDDRGDAKAEAMFVPAATTSKTADARLRPGDHFGPVFNGFAGRRDTADYDQLRLERGTRVVANAERLGLAVLRVEGGDVKSLLQRYGSQMGRSRVQNLTWNGVQVPYVTHSVGDGGYGTLNADTSGKWILLTTWSD